MQKRVLIITDHYAPGYKAGGVLRAVLGLVEQLGHQFELSVLTTDRDLNDHQAYPNIASDEWQSIGHASVYYASPRTIGLKSIRKVLKDKQFDAIYLSSFYSKFSRALYVLMYMGLLNTPVIIAPHGQLTPIFIRYKHWKKGPFNTIAKAIGLHKRVIWHATSQEEAKHIRDVFPECIVSIAHNISSNKIRIRNEIRFQQDPLRLVYFGRITKKKNLSLSLEILKQVTANVRFDIIGPAEDLDYTRACQRAVEDLPKNITVRFLGAMEPHQLENVLPKYDALLFPTQSENFSYTIIEALCHGVIPIISDQTYWSFLGSNKAGYVIPLDKPEVFTKVIDALSKMNIEDLSKMRLRAMEAAAEYINHGPSISEHCAMLELAMQIHSVKLDQAS